MEGFTTESKIELFRQMLSCCHMLLLAEYDAQLHRIGKDFSLPIGRRFCLRTGST